MHNIHVDWGDIRPFDEALADEGNGLYQILGTHPIYDRDSPTLLYIGEVTAGTMGSRLQKHHDNWVRQEIEQYRNPIRVRVGRISSGPHLHEEIQVAEKVLIWWHTPAYNSKNIARPPVLDPWDAVKVTSGDDSGLLPEVKWSAEGAFSTVRGLGEEEE